MVKTIKVKEEDWEKLWTIRMRLKLKTIGESVSFVLKKVKVK